MILESGPPHIQSELNSIRIKDFEWMTDLDSGDLMPLEEIQSARDDRV